MSDSQEPSYYEVALTNRQVLFSFVVLLSCVLLAFVFGVWVGRSDDPGIGGGSFGDDPIAQLGDGPDLPSSSTVGDSPDDGPEDGGEPLRKPDLSRLAADPPSGTTLAQDVGSADRTVADDPAAETASEEPPPPPVRTAPPPPRSTPPPPPPPPRATTPASDSATAGLVIQVFSSRDASQADKVMTQLRNGGYRAFLSPTQVEGRTMFRVRIGPYDDRAPAERAAAEIKSQFKLDTWITAADG